MLRRLCHCRPALSRPDDKFSAPPHGSYLALLLPWLALPWVHRWHLLGHRNAILLPFCLLRLAALAWSSCSCPAPGPRNSEGLYLPTPPSRVSTIPPPAPQSLRSRIAFLPSLLQDSSYNFHTGIFIFLLPENKQPAAKLSLSEYILGASQMVLVLKNLSANAGDIRDVSLIPGLGRSPGGGHSNPLQFSCLENLMDRGDWRATVCRVAQSQTRRLK